MGLGVFFEVNAEGEDVKAGSICGDSVASAHCQQVQNTKVAHILILPSGSAGLSIKLMLFVEWCETLPSPGDCTAADECRMYSKLLVAAADSASSPGASSNGT
jgi:hypothetical protein